MVARVGDLVAGDAREEFAAQFDALLRYSGFQAKQVVSGVMSKRPQNASWTVTAGVLSAWRTGRNLPSKPKQAGFLLTVRILTERARGRMAAGHPVRDLLDEVAWAQLLDQARSTPPPGGDRSADARASGVEMSTYAADIQEMVVPGGPASMLDPRRGVVPFVGREAEVEELLAWCENGPQQRVRLLTGPAGVGKTRLVLELRDRLRQRGWVTAVVREGKEAEAVAAVRTGCRGPVILIVDYAETRAGLSELLQAAAQDNGHLRVVLVARNDGEWRDRLMRAEPLVRALMADAEPVAVRPELGTRLSQTELAEQAVACFAKTLGVQVAGAVCLDGGSGSAPILVLHAAALVAMLDFANTASTPSGAPPITRVSPDRDRVLASLLGHEGRYWGTATPGDDFGPVLQARAVAVASLLGASSEADAATLFKKIPDLSDAHERDLRAIARWARGRYPGTDPSWLGSLQPDILAEYHITTQLAAAPDLAAACLKDLSPDQTVRALVILTRACAHRPEAASIIAKGLRTDPPTLFLAGIAVASMIGEPLGQLLAEAITEADFPLPVLMQLGSAIPPSTVILAKSGIKICERVLSLLSEIDNPGERVRWLNRHAIWLAGDLRTVEARDAAEEAVRISRQLAAGDPAQYAHQLGQSLDNLAVSTMRLDRAYEALAVSREAVEVYRGLAELDAQRRPDLGMALKNLGIALAHIGGKQTALDAFQEAVRINRTWAESEPDYPESWNTLALSLFNVGACLIELGRTAEAAAPLVEAMRLLRELGETFPYAFGFEADPILVKVAVSLEAAGASESARMALESCLQVRQAFAGAAISQQRSDWAELLMTFGEMLATDGHAASAVAAIQDAAGVYRELSANDPEQRPGLIRCLKRLGFHLADDRRHTEGVAAYREGMALNQEMSGVSEWEQVISAAGLLYESARRQDGRLSTEWAVLMLAVTDALEHDRAPTEERADIPSLREMLLWVANYAAGKAGDWQRAIDFNHRIRVIKEGLGETSVELAEYAFRDFLPLIRLGRIKDADRVAEDCQRIFEQDDPDGMLGQILRARADAVGQLGRPASAIAFGMRALGYSYDRMKPKSELGMDHFNYATHLDRGGEDRSDILAHNLAACFLFLADGNLANYDTAVKTLTARWMSYQQQGLATTCAELAALVDETPGVKFQDLLLREFPDLAEADPILRGIIAVLNALAASYHLYDRLLKWPPVLNYL